MRGVAAAAPPALRPTSRERGADGEETPPCRRRASSRQTIAVTGRAADLNLTGHALTPGAQRSWWLREALAHETFPDCPALATDITPHVVIVGAGFTGLSPPHFLSATQPTLPIVALD